MVKTTRKNVLIVLGVVLVSAFGYAFFYWPISPLGKQLQNLKIAGEFSKKLSEKLGADPRFQKVTFGSYTGSGGCVSVGGRVESDEDVRLLTNAVESANCPLAIYYSLGISNGLGVFEWFNKGGAPVWIK
jgi:hypothetical protein